MATKTRHRTGANLSYQGRKPLKKKRTRDNAKFDGMRITKLVRGNPRRPGTDGYSDWEVIRNGMSYETFRKNGGSRRRLEENIARGFVKVN
jgi:hypothetical protein